MIARDEGGCRFAGHARKVVEFADLWMRHHERPIFGADGVIRRQHAGLTDARQVDGVEKIEDGVAAAKLKNQPAPSALGLVILGTACAAHDRRDRGELSNVARGRHSDSHGLAMARDEILGERDHLDHALISFARAFAEGDDAVLAENKPVAWFRALENVDRLFREPEARHEVGHERQAVLKDFGAARGAVGLVDQTEQCGRVGVIDEFVRQERVQHDLDGRIWRRRIDKIDALDRQEFVVADRLKRA